MAKKRQNNVNAYEANNIYDTKKIKNANASTITSEPFQELLKMATKARSLDSLANWGIGITAFFGFSYYWVFILTAIFIAFKVYLRKTQKITLAFGEEDTSVLPNFYQIVEATHSAKLWRIVETSSVKNTKYSAGASNVLNRKKCSASTFPPFPFSTAVECATFKSRGEVLFFLPSMLIVIQGSKVGAIDYADVDISITPHRFVEDKSVPSDAKVVDYTYKYVNKRGGADKRFNDNKKLPICLYGNIAVKSEQGVNSRIIFSRTNVLEQ